METSRKSIDSAQDNVKPQNLFPELNGGNTALLIKPLGKQTVGKMQKTSFED